MKADMKARVSNLAKTASEWSKFNFKPLPGEVIIYLPESNCANACVKIKVGDGVQSLQELPFVVEHIAEELLADYKRDEVFDAGHITDYFN
jgi:hypothetical protein